MDAVAPPTSANGSRSAKLSRVLASAVLLGGLLVIAGWALDNRTLKGIRPGLVEMKFNTAGGFLAIGTAVLLVGRRTPAERAWKIGLILAAFVSLLGALTLLEYLLRIDLHIDQLICRDDPGEVGTASPGRMAVSTSIAFVLAGLGAMLLYRCDENRCWPLNITSSGILGLGVPSLVGYVYGIHKLYGIAGMTEMAVHTAVLFVFLAGALMSARPRCGLIGILTSDRAGGYFARRVLPAAVLIPVALGAVLAVGGDFGTHDTAYAATLSAVVFLIVFVGFLWFTAVTLDKVDARRIESEREIAARLERDKAAEKLRESEKRFRELADAMPQLVWTCNVDGSADYWNQRSAEYLGRPVVNLLGRQWTECLHPDDSRRTIDGWQAAVESRTAYEIEFRFRTADGSYRWQLARGLPSIDAGGRVVRWFGTCTDVDDQRKMMEALRESDRLKDQFLATMSHELRTPLTSILGWSSLLREQGAPTEMFAEAVEAIHRNAVAQARLVEDLLDVSRIVQGKLRLEAKPMDLSAVVAEAVRTAAQTSPDRMVNVSLKLSDAPVWIHGDPHRCRQVVINLVTNAIKFGDQTTPPNVTLDVEGPSAVLTVSNAGDGITAEFLPHVFERFRQQDGSLTRKHQGLGLGLSIVKNLVEMHGGTVEAASDGPGLGARFTSRFPAIAAPAV